MKTFDFHNVSEKNIRFLCRQHSQIMPNAYMCAEESKRFSVKS